MASVARTQYVDWTKIRLKDSRSTDRRQAVNVIVERLVQIEENLTSVQIKNEEQEASEKVDTEGLYDVIAEIEKHLPAWHEAVLSHQGTLAQYDAARGVYERQRVRASPGSATHAALIRYGDALAPLVQRSLAEAKEYSARTIALDPYIVKATRLAAVSVEGRTALAPIYERVRDGAEEALKEETRSGPHWAYPSELFDQSSHLSQRFAELAQKQKRGEEYGLEANSIVLRWSRQLEDLMRDRL